MPFQKGNKLGRKYGFQKGHQGYKFWLGKKLSDEHKRKLSKAHLGKHHTEEAKKRIGKAQKGNKWALGKHWKFSYIRKGSCGMLGKKHTQEWKDKHSKKTSGEKHYNWNVGVSRDKHSWDKRYKQWRKAVFARDNYTCRECKKVGVYLEAHHIKSWAKYPKLRYKIDNGLTLCEDCHKLTDNYKGKINKKYG